MYMYDDATQRDRMLEGSTSVARRIAELRAEHEELRFLVTTERDPTVARLMDQLIAELRLQMCTLQNDPCAVLGRARV